MLNPKEIENLSELLLDKDDLNTKVALEILDGNPFPKELLTEIFAIYKLTENKEFKQKTAQLLKNHASESVRQLMQSRVKLKGGESFDKSSVRERTVTKNISKYCAENELSGEKLALALFKKYGIGIHYLITSLPSDSIKENLRGLIVSNKIELGGLGLKKIPKELFELTELEEIDLFNNSIKTIPSQINKLKNLRVLDLRGNYLKSLHKNILKLEGLEEVYFEQNYILEFPEVIKKLWKKIVLKTR